MTDQQLEAALTTDQPELIEIADAVWAYVQPDGTWWINNTGLIGGADGDIIVDTCATEQRTATFLRAATAARGALDMRFAVNTHLHGDHTYGNSLLPAATTIVGHQAMRAGLAADTLIDGCAPFWTPLPNWGRVTKRLPTLTYTSALTLYSGSRQIDVLHPGYPAHTAGDSAVWLPAERTLFTGDLLFHGLTPLVFMGSVAGALRALNWIHDLRPAVLVPGHGPVVDASDIADVLGQHERYFRFVLRLGRDGHAAGLSPLDVALGADLGEFASWGDSERLVMNLHRVYADEDGRDVDPAAAFRDAITYHGGLLPSHV